MYKYRLNLTEEEAQELKELFSSLDFDKESMLQKKIYDIKIIHNTDKKKEAMKKATKARTKTVKEKINNAMNLILFENTKLSHYRIAKVSEVSFVTVVKYVNQNTINSLNNIITEKQSRFEF
jgi:hypothetical protein